MTHMPAASRLPKTVAAQPPIGGGQTVFYPWASPFPRPLIVRAEGIRMWDDQGRDYIDLSSGPVVSNIGHGNVHVAEAMKQQALTVDFAYCANARSQANLDLTERIARLAGPGFERVCLSSGGSEAVEVAVKFLRMRALSRGETDRTQIITCDPSYHGSTLLTLAMSGDPDCLPFIAGMIAPSARVPAPITYRLPPNHTPETHAAACADALEARIKSIGADRVLAFFLEPVGGLATGASVPPASYFRRIREICTAHSIALVFDEVLCGTGRTGKFLAAHNWPDALPDMVVMAKGLGSGYAPLAATLVPAVWADELAQTTGFAFSHTYSANPIACATGLAVLDEYDRLGVLANTRQQGAALREGLEALKRSTKVVGDVRGMGLLLALELVTDQASKGTWPTDFSPVDLIKRISLEHGLLIYGRRTALGSNGDWIMVSPPMTITAPECAELLQRLTATLTAFETECRRLGVIGQDAPVTSNGPRVNQEH